jgi:16S rRNA (guanine527-N7)-methyltransferase
VSPRVSSRRGAWSFSLSLDAVSAGEPAGKGQLPVSPAAAPAAAVEAYFGVRSPLAEAFAEHLGTTAVERGLLGPREVPRLWTRHILNCAAVAPLLPQGADVVDVGSGAGLPGIVLAIARKDVHVTLVEPLLRRVAWLEEVTSDLGLGNVAVLRGRAEELDGGWADVATARAVAPLAKLSAWCLPLVRSGGTMLAIKGRSAAEELVETADRLPPLGAVQWRVVEVGGELLEEATTVVEIRKGDGPPRSSPGGKRARRSRR